MAVKLSKAEAEAMAPGDVLRCHVVKGLELHAKPTGKMWTFYYRQNGKRRRPKLGEFPTLSLEAAREAARGYVKDVAAGKDPSADRAAARVAPKVRDLSKLYVDRVKLRVKRGELKQRYSDEIERYRARYVDPLLGHLEVRAVTREDVNKALDKCAEGKVTWEPVKGTRPKKGGKSAANGLRAALSSMFTYAEDEDVKMRDANTNPAKGATVFKRLKRRVRIQGVQFETAGAALEKLRTEHREDVIAIRTILFCGSRVSEITEAPRAALECRFEIVDGKPRTFWTLNLDVHKTDREGEPRVIRLPEQVALELNSLGMFGERLFPPHVTRYTVGDVWRRAREIAGCPEIQLRDMRRTFASMAKSAGASLGQAGELLGHNSPQTTDLYSFLFDDAAADLAQATADEIEKRMKGGAK